MANRKPPAKVGKKIEGKVPVKFAGRKQAEAPCPPAKGKRSKR